MICKQLVAVAVAVAVAVVAAVAVEVRTLVVPSVVTSDLATSFLLSKDTIIRREQVETIFKYLEILLIKVLAYLTTIRRRRDEYCRIIPRRHRGDYSTIFTEAGPNKCFSIISELNNRE